MLWLSSSVYLGVPPFFLLVSSMGVYFPLLIPLVYLISFDVLTNLIYSFYISLA